MHSYNMYSEIEEILIKHVPESELLLLAKADSLVCKALKLANLKYNSILSRFKTYNRMDLLSVKKYKDAIEYLYL